MSLIAGYRAAYAGLPRPVWMLAIAAFINRSGTMVLPFLVLWLAGERGYTDVQAGAFLALHGAGSVLGMVAGGNATDRVGALTVQFTSLTCSGVNLILLAFVSGTVPTAALVLTLGIVGEAFRPASMAAIAEYSAPALRPRAFGLQRLAINLGWTVGPVLGGFLARIDFALLFWIDGATSLAAAAFLWLALRSSRPRAAASDAEDTASRSPWRDRVFLVALALVLPQALVFLQLQSTFPLYLREQRGAGTEVIGILLAVNTILIVLVEMPLIRAIERFDPLKVVGLAGLLVSAGFGLLPWAPTTWWVAATVAVWTLGEMLGAPMFVAWISNRAGKASQGAYMAAFGLCFAVAAIGAPALGTWAYARLGPDGLWHACLAIGVVDMAAFLLLARSARRELGR